MSEEEARKSVIRKARKIWKGVDEVIVPRFILDLAGGKLERLGTMRGYVVEKEGKKILVLAPKLRPDLVRRREERFLKPRFKLLTTERASDFHTHKRGKTSTLLDMMYSSSITEIPITVVTKKSVRTFVPDKGYETKIRGRRPPDVKFGKIIKPTILSDAEVLKLIKKPGKRKGRRGRRR